jgi:Ca-activated chloride channel family protein
VLALHHPWLLLTLLLPPLVLAWRWWRARADLRVVPYAAAWRPSADPRWPHRELLPLVALALLGVAAARPVLLLPESEQYAKGYDFMLAVDLSTSMLAEDYELDGEPANRLDALRPVLRAFISGRPDDRAGVVVFAGAAYTLAPLTTDKAWLDAEVAALSVGAIEDGTALGDGLGIALANLEESRGSESSDGAFVVLLTDGSNNSGTLAPLDAANLARGRGVPVYAIGAGTVGMVPFPVFDATGERNGTRMRPSSFDEPTLLEIATRTGGEYFAADDSEALRDAFERIDASRKADLSSRRRVREVELYLLPVLTGLVLLLLQRPRTRPGAPAAESPA